MGSRARPADRTFLRGPIDFPATTYAHRLSHARFWGEDIESRARMCHDNEGTQRYAVGMAVSATGQVAGPWQQLDLPLFAADGGHGMIFRTFAGQLMLALHQPNSGSRERARFFQLIDVGDRLEIVITDDQPIETTAGE